MKKLIYLLIVSLLIVSVGCSNDTSDIDEIRLKVYKSSIDMTSGEYEIQDELLFTNNDIESINWSNQEYVLKRDFLEKLNIVNKDDSTYIGGSLIFGTKPSDMFSIYIDGEFIYSGYFEQSFLSSFYATGAVIKDIENGIEITYVDTIGNSQIKDKRFDERIKKVLRELELIDLEK